MNVGESNPYDIRKNAIIDSIRHTDIEKYEGHRTTCLIIEHVSSDVCKLTMFPALYESLSENETPTLFSKVYLMSTFVLVTSYFLDYMYERKIRKTQRKTNAEYEKDERLKKIYSVLSS